MLRTPLIFLPSRQRTWAAIQRDRGPCGSWCARREGVQHAHGGGPGGQSRRGRRRRRVIFMSSEDADANAAVSALCERLGFYPINLGRISEGGRLQQFGGPLSAQNLVRMD